MENRKDSDHTPLDRRDFLRLGIGSGLAVAGFTSAVLAERVHKGLNQGSDLPGTEIEELTIADLSARMASGKDTAHSIVEKIHCTD